MQGALQWMAPEALKAGYDKKADVFSFGVVMYTKIYQLTEKVQEG